MNTTLYNHKPIGTDDKPLIDNAEFMRVLILVQGGDTGAYNEAKSKYTIEPKQDKILTDIINNNVI